MKPKTPELYAFQDYGSSWLAERKTALLADRPGLGKTVQAIRAAQKVGAQTILVLCIGTVKRNWLRQCEFWGLNQYRLTCCDTGKSAISAFPKQVVTVSYDLLLNESIFNQLSARKWDVVILDEAHMLKNHKAQRTRAVFGARGLARTARKALWALTGSPMMNRPEELFVMLSTMFPEAIKKYPSYRAYTEHFCDGQTGKRGNWEAKGATNQEELAALLAPHMLRRSEDEPEIAAQMPKVICHEIILDGGRDIDEDIRNEMLAFKDSVADQGTLSSLQARLGMAKASQVVDFCKARLTEVDKLVVFAYHRDLIEYIAAELAEYGAVKYYGGVSDKDKDAAVKSFVEKKKPRVFVGGITSAGTGLDLLQKVCDNVVIAEMTWTPEQIVQAIGRLKRLGSVTNKVQAYFTFFPGSVDEIQFQAVKNKERNIARILQDKTKGVLSELVRLRTSKTGDLEI